MNMRLSRAAECVNRIIRPVGKVFHPVGMGVLAAMMLLTASDVILRYVFNRPIVGSFDLMVYMMAILVAFSLSYCAVMKGHVKVDLLEAHLPQRMRAIINSITCFLGFSFLSLVTWQCFVKAKVLYASGIASTVLLIPAFPFAGVVAFGVALLTLVVLTDLLDFISQAVRK